MSRFCLISSFRSLLFGFAFLLFVPSWCVVRNRAPHCPALVGTCALVVPTTTRTTNHSPLRQPTTIMLSSSSSSSLPRRGILSASAMTVASLLLGGQHGSTAAAWSTTPPPSSSSRQSQPAAGTSPVENSSSPAVAYRPLSVEMKDFGVRVPVAMWYPVGETRLDGASQDSSGITWTDRPVTYNHRISVRKIGELLAGWDFIPEFIARDYLLSPTCGGGVVVAAAANGVARPDDAPIPTQVPVVVLAHGYLGSRFDLSHLAEALAQKGFLCISAEYPESLAASYPRIDGLDRSKITDALLYTLYNDWGVQATSFGIVGHSLGCGTAMTTGDDTWTRVCIAGFPRTRDGASIPGNVLFLTSMNDGAVSLSRFGGKSAIPADYALLDEAQIVNGGGLSKLPRRAALVFDRPDAPNHISFLSDGVNTAMIDLLSPLLPVAQAMRIPVLDFDKYQESRDSDATAQVVIPLVSSYLQQHMKQ